jgi:hypothetical protein
VLEKCTRKLSEILKELTTLPRIRSPPRNRRNNSMPVYPPSQKVGITRNSTSSNLIRIKNYMDISFLV